MLLYSSEWSIKNCEPFHLRAKRQIDHNNWKLCTTAFLVEIAQHIKIGDLTTFDESAPSLSQLDANSTLSTAKSSLPSLSPGDLEGYPYIEPRLSNEEEDALLKVIRL